MNNILEKKHLSIKNLKEYIYANRYIYMVAIFILFMIYSRQLYVLNARIDTETVINNPHQLSFITNNRQGALFTRIVFEQLNFNPYFATVLSFFVLIASMIVLGYMFQWLGKMKGGTSVSIFLIFIVHPIWAEQMYFTLQVLEISVGIFITILATLISFWGILYNKIPAKILSVFLMIWAFSTYQLFVLLYIAITLFSFILFYRYLYLTNKKEKIDTKICIKLVFQLIIMFFIAMIINSVITNLFFSSGNQYLMNQIRWGKDSVEICINNIISHIKNVILGEGIFYSYGYITSVVLMLSCLLYDALKIKNVKLKWLYVLSSLVLQICPFLLTIYQAREPYFRSQFILPFVIACNIGFTIKSFEDKKRIKGAIYCIGIIIFMTQAQTVMRLQYTDDIRFQEDIRLGEQISERISIVTDGIEKPIAFVGTKSARLNAACVKGELIGESIFNHDAGSKPHYLGSSNRIITLLNTMGFSMKNVSDEQMLEARKVSIGMTVWPAKDSVYDAGDFVIVKLSEDRWYVDDIMEAESENVEISNINFENEKFKWAVDKSIVENDIIKIWGWIIQPHVSSQGANVSVYLINEKDGMVFKLTTASQHRPDVTRYFEKETNYNNSGYVAKGKLSELHDYSNPYKIVLCYENGYEKIYVDTGKYIHK